MKAFQTFIKPFEASQKIVKIKIWLNFFTLSGIGPLRVKWVVNILFMSSPIGTIYTEWTLFHYMLEFQLSCFGILEKYIRPRIFSIDKENHLC